MIILSNKMSWNLSKKNGQSFSFSSMVQFSLNERMALVMVVFLLHSVVCPSRQTLGAKVREVMLWPRGHHELERKAAHRQ
jgi:hypothetical protein